MDGLRPLMTLTQTCVCPYVPICSRMSIGDWDLFPWNGRGRSRLVELTDVCLSEGGFQGSRGE